MTPPCGMGLSQSMGLGIAWLSYFEKAAPCGKVLLDNQYNLIIIRPARALVLELADRHG
jgi:hypothetical protein